MMTRPGHLGRRHLPRALGAIGALSILAAATPALAQALERHPYLQRMGPHEVTVVWTTDAASDSVVHYGSTPDQLDQTVSLGSATTQHEVRLAGLSPGAIYFYDVGSSAGPLAGGDAEHTFRTAPLPATRGKLRAWVVGDSGTGGSAQLAVRDAMLAHVGAYDLPQLFLHVGDMAYDTGTTSEFTDNFFAPYRGVLRRVPTFPVIGNHEGSSSDSASQTGPYYTAYVTPRDGELGGLASGTEAYYSFDWANVHFIALDSHETSRSPSGPMLTWARDDALATDQEWIVAFWHHPPYTKGTHDSDDESQLIEMRENALPILEAAGVDLVLAGHSHIYERSFLVDGAYDTPTTAPGHIVDPGDGKPLGTGPYRKSPGQVANEGAVYVVAGHGGAGVGGDADHPLMVVSEVEHGSCLLDVQGNRLAMLNVRADGSVTDRFTLVKGTGLVVGTPDGGEVLAPGSETTIRWATVGSVPTVDLDLSLDAGATWAPIARGLANGGELAWTVPTTPTYQGLVRVRSAADADVADESNASFVIAAAPVEVVPWGAPWKYRDEDVDPGADWMQPGSADADWIEGPAELGYGDGDEATVLLDADPNVPTVYFRHHVELTAPLLAASLEVLYDDGVAVWVNGTPVLARNVAEGAAHADFASSASEDDSLASADVPPGTFVVGDNVIAALVKQADGASSDVSFDLRLEVVLQPPEPPTTSSAATGAGGGASGAGGSGPGATSGPSGSAAAGPPDGLVGAGGSGSGAAADEGCGCEVPGARGRGRGAAPVAAALLALVWVRLRRRRA